MRHSPSPSRHGFTIIELLIVIVVIGVLMTIAAPQLRQMIISNQVRSVTADLVNDLAVARSEAGKLGQRVVLCPTTTQNQALNSIVCAASNNWSTGWIAFVDSTTVDNQRTTSGTPETILRIKEGLPASVSFRTTGAPNFVSFRAIGVMNAAASFTVCPADASYHHLARTVSVTALGKVQSAAGGPCP
ncbi:MAG: GspH/FimT family pseudopilin [Burkholderiales bacterium]